MYAALRYVTIRLAACSFRSVGAQKKKQSAEQKVERDAEQ